MTNGADDVGWAGLEPATNALKGRCSTSELPTRDFSLSSLRLESQPTPKAFGAALPIELPTRAEPHFLVPVEFFNIQ